MCYEIEDKDSNVLSQSAGVAREKMIYIQQTSRDD